MRVADYRAQSGLLRDALDPVLAEPIPERLLAAASPAALPEPSLVRRWGIPALAAAATLILGLGLGWFGRDAMIERAGTPTTFARSAAYAHALYAADARRPVEVWAAEEKSLVNWLTKRLGFKVYAPDLNGFGYALVGGRLVAGNEFPTALFMYENADKERLSLQVRKQSARRLARAPPPAAKRRSVMRSRTASACSTGSTTKTADTRSPASSIALSSSNWRTSSTPNWLFSRRRPQVAASRLVPRIVPPPAFARYDSGHAKNSRPRRRRR